MSEQGNENETSQFSALGPANEGGELQESDNPFPSIFPPDANNESESKPRSVTESGNAVSLEVPDSEDTDDSSEPFLPEQKSGITTPRPSREVSERHHLETSPPPDTIVENFRKVSSTDSGSAAPRADVEDLNDFRTDGSDTFHCDIEEEAGTELDSMSYPSAFDQHTRGTGDKPYGCKFCTRRFSHRSSLYRHQKSHSGEKLYKCTECKKSFTNSSNLSVHSRIHTGEKPYECNGCGKKFTRKFALDQHVKIHKQEKLYICSHCGKSYYDYFFLLKHQQMERPSPPYIPDSIMK
ncbi:zinc finger protein 135-like [Hyla sarda]|uniref:zinc finger protein 135-like n=1 Tax=Hyla sarda TaxID=327740 RepID=UPI0024C39F2D|nr:zinc finger protein 135-like [Hyla sarda]